MAMADQETLRVRAGLPKRGKSPRSAWHQLILIGGEGEEAQVLLLKSRSLDKITQLREAIGEVVSTHEQWSALQRSSTMLEGAGTLKKLVLGKNRQASALLSSHGIRLKGFILP